MIPINQDSSYRPGKVKHIARNGGAAVSEWV